jgi:signal transduction histidine kinase
MRVAAGGPTFPLEGALQALASGVHVCSICEHELEYLDLIVPFVRIGLERGEKCVCIAEEGNEGHIEQALSAAGTDVAAARERTALVLMSPQQAYLKGDSFDPYRMFTFWKDLSSRARGEGFSRLRGVGDMQWILRGAPGAQRWLAYERNLTQLAADHQCLLLCQYRRPNFRPEDLLDVIRTHPLVIHRGTVAQNIYYLPSDVVSQTEQHAPELENLLNDLRKREHADYVLRQQREEDERRTERRLNVALTEQQIAEATLRATQSELVRVSRLTTLGELTASIAHEVNQPLAAIIAHGGAARRWLDRSSPNIDEAVKAIEGAIANASRAHEVIARIRALARKADNERELLDLNEIIREILALTAGEFRQNSVTLRTDFDPTLPRTYGDRVQLQQVALNLVMNGVEAICALTEGPRELAIRTSLNDRQELHVAVRDSGVGLAEVYLQRIFEPFYTTKPQGMGIGLSISRSIVQAHYGRLWAERNKDASGITVHFTVPVRDRLAGEGDPGVPRV